VQIKLTLQNTSNAGIFFEELIGRLLFTRIFKSVHEV